MKIVLCGLAVALLLLIAPTARAGTYTVSTCTPPGGPASGPGAWTAASIIPGGTSAFDLNLTCLPGPSVSPKPGGWPRFTTSSIRFQAPAGATIRTARLWSAIYAQNGWGVKLVDGVGRDQPQTFLPATCVPRSDGTYTYGSTPCRYGEADKTGDPSTTIDDLGSDALEILVFCAADSCPGGLTNAGGSIYASTITVQEDAPPSATLGGPATSGWTTGPAGSLTATAADPTGVREVRILADGAPLQQAAGTCRIDTARPCDDLQVPVAQLPEGRRTITIEATDGAGNVGSSSVPVQVDRTPPVVSFVPGSGRAVAVAAPDAISGLRGGTLAYAGRSGKFKALKTRRRGDVLTARLPGKRPKGLRVRVTATDVAGNQVTASSDRALRASAGFAGRRVAYTAYASGRTLTGRVRSRAGAPLAGVPVTITPTVLRRGAKAGAPIVVTTDAGGRFRYRAPAGFSRRLEVRVASAGGEPGITVDAALLVHAASTIAARPSTIAAGGRIRFSGTLRRRGAGVPKGGKLLDLQGFERGRWRTFATDRTNSRGRWRFRYRFSATSAGRSFRVRVRIRRESTYPFHVGASRAVRVRVR